MIEKKAKGHKSFAVLIDPDENKLTNLESTIRISKKHSIDYFFIGGSLIIQDKLEQCIQELKAKTNIPIIIFPGNGFQLNQQADALLYLSLVSGRNAEYLIGKQIEIAPKLIHTSLEIISTAYMLIDGKNSNTASYISQTQPIPYDKVEIAIATAYASQLLGFKLIYMDAGSGALQVISKDMISRVAAHIHLPMIIGGGIDSADKANDTYMAGADMIVVGNAIEQKPSLIAEIADVTNSYNYAFSKKK